jgi:diacylglycerol kinase (ATP)
MQPRVVIVFNPVSGRGRSGRFAQELASALERRGRSVELVETRRDADVFEELEVEGLEAVVVLGGDGSANAAVNGLRSLTTPVAYGGTGTTNVLGLELELPREPEELAGLIAAGRTRTVPLPEANGRRWVMFAEAGFMGTVVRTLNRRRAGGGAHGRLEVLLSALSVLPRAWGRPLRARLETADGAVLERRYSNVLATRARRYGGVLPMPTGDVDLGSPRFRVIGCRTRTPLGHLAVLGLAACRLLERAAPLLERLGAIECTTCAVLDVDGPASEGVHVDAESEVGDVELALPLHVEATDRSLELIVP